MIRQNLAVPDDDPKQIIEVVSNATRQATDCLHLLCLSKLIFQSAPGSDVSIYDDQLLDQAILSADRACGRFEVAPSAVLVTHTVFNPSTGAGCASLVTHGLDKGSVFRMDLFKRGGLLKFIDG